MSPLPPDSLRAAMELAFPAAWRAILEQRVSFYRRLSEAEQERFEDKVQHFVLSKTFEIDGGLEVTDEMKVLVAAAACRLTVNLGWAHYAHVGVVGLRTDDAWHHHGTRVTGLGSQWKVTLSWPALLHGLALDADGDNVGYHEFAHALDGSDGSMDGEVQGPPGPGAMFSVWAEVIADARAEVVRAIRAGVAPAIDAYAGTSDVELFAVATEWFFERPAELRAGFPDLYALLCGCYHQDPAARGAGVRWEGGDGRGP